MASEPSQLSDHLFGTATLELGMLTGAQVGECLLLLSQNGGRSSLAAVSVEYGYLTQRDADHAVAHAQQLHRRLLAESSLFGRVAMSLKLLTREQLERCVARQRQSSFQKKLGQAAVELG